MSFVHRKQLAASEEKERDRRIAQQDLEERVLTFNRSRESEASWIASIIGEGNLLKSDSILTFRN